MFWDTLHQMYNKQTRLAPDVKGEKFKSLNVVRNTGLVGIHTREKSHSDTKPTPNISPPLKFNWLNPEWKKPTEVIQGLGREAGVAINSNPRNSRTPLRHKKNIWLSEEKNESVAPLMYFHINGATNSIFFWHSDIFFQHKKNYGGF